MQLLLVVLTSSKRKYYIQTIYSRRKKISVKKSPSNSMMLRQAFEILSIATTNSR